MNVSDDFLMKNESSFFCRKHKENEMNSDLIQPLDMDSNFILYEDESQIQKKNYSKSAENEFENNKTSNSNDNINLYISSEQPNKLPLKKSKKGKWTLEEDKKLIEWVKIKGSNNWKKCKKFVGRIGKQCRERWYNVLNPNIKKGKWSKNEINLLFDLFNKYGTKWSIISKFFEGRTENALKNRFYSMLRKHFNIKNGNGNKINQSELKNIVSKIRENYNQTGQKKYEKSLENIRMVDDFIKSYCYNDEKAHQQSTVNNNLINSVYDEYNNMTEDCLENTLKNMCRKNPFREKIPIKNLIEITVDEFVENFFNKKELQDLEFCGKCFIPKSFQNLERENINNDLHEEDNNQLDNFIDRIYKLEELMKETLEELREIKEGKESYHM